MVTENNDNRADLAVTAEKMRTMATDDLLVLASKLALQLDSDAEPDECIDAIVERQTLLAETDVEVFLELLTWGNRHRRAGADKADLACEIASMRKMSFDGLSPEALLLLAHLRDMAPQPDDGADTLIDQLKQSEGLLAKLARKRRRLVGKLIGKLVGDNPDEAPPDDKPNQRHASLKERIEDRGLVGGLADKLRGAADDYIALKLDEIEERLDKKLDEIDSRLTLWRDREIRNRLKIIKITLTASIIVALISVVIAWVQKQLGP